MIICADGLSGIKEAIAAAFPQTEYQRCMVHMVRNTMKYVPCVLFLLSTVLLANLYFYYNNALKNSTLVEFVIIGLSLFYFFTRNTLSCISIILLRFLDVVNAASVLFIFALGKGELSKKVEKSQLLYSCVCGGYSMYLFLLHYPIRVTIGELFIKHELCNYPFGFIIEVLTILLFTVFFSIVLKKLLKR